MSRISFEKGIEKFKTTPLEELQREAAAVRNQKNPKNRVTFVIDSNPNYTNICNADCSFCAFYRHPGAKDAYQKTVDEALKSVERAHQAGCSTVMMQGGLADYPLEFYTELVRQTRLRYPSILPHYFTAPEIWNCAKVNHLSLEEVLQALYDVGQRSLPGGGAELLSERVRLTISPKKMAPGAWIEVHKTAHRVGMRSTATMMYGHIEEAEDILLHLDALRTLQDETGGFTAFIPWSYKPDRTALRRKVKDWVGDVAYLRLIAFSRLYLDNFDHIQASWFSEGVEVGIKALQGGADDFGGIILEENVHRATGFVHRADISHMLRYIRQAGFTPVERNCLYEILKIYDSEEVLVPVAQAVDEENQLAIISRKRS
ncbi:MAG: CofH family radical SAM protein [Verrucomicrobia bacterium]|nr:CofH family radical SAM protein [Verrucomicrobiota bacterium]